MSKDADRNAKPRRGRGFLFAALGAAACTLCAAYLGFAVDWTLLCLALAVIMPVLFGVDVLAMAVVAWGAARAGAGGQEGRIVRLTTLAAVHLASAVLAVVLLAVPAGSVWAEGITLGELRLLLVAVSGFGLFLSFEIPYAVASALAPAPRAKEDAGGGRRAGSAPEAPAAGPESGGGEFAVVQAPGEADPDGRPRRPGPVDERP